MASSPLLTISTVASNAAFVGSSLSNFAGQVPEATTELTGIVSGLFGLCSAMHHFESAARNYGLQGFSGDLNARLSSILRDATGVLTEVEMIVQEMDIACSTKGVMQKNMIKQVAWMLKEQETPLITRLESHKNDMSLLLASLHANAHSAGGQAPSPLYEEFERRLNFDDYGVPESPIDYRSPTSPHSGVSGWSGFSGVSSVSPVQSRRASFSSRMHDRTFFDRGFARTLPPNPHFVSPLPPRPKSAYQPLRNTEFVQYIDPTQEDHDGSSSSQSSDYRYRYAQAPPAHTHEALVPVQKFGYGRRRSQPNIQKLNLNVLVGSPDDFADRRTKVEHWASKVFDGMLGETKFVDTEYGLFPSLYKFPSGCNCADTSVCLISVNKSSQCFGRRMDVIRKDTEEELLRMKFASDFIVRFWRCNKTQKTRIVCQVGRRSSAERYHSAMDMAWLTIWREGPLVHLRFKNTKWATLSFANIEDLVVFYMTFLVLRQLGRHPPDLDHEMDMDEEFVVFSGLISDDEGGEHFLRVFRDENTGAVRLAAFVKDGDLHQLPVWTAFVTPYLFQKGWLTRQSSRVQLASIHLVSFSDTWATRAYRNWELLFSGREDAKDFERVVKIDLRQSIKAEMADS
ncbi:hypothetical protein Dda_1896 [Drechslerella dactyloides]|uniref:Uncharacterized protein n=1 Tax=Drechslerella dactyloides TaxID=74499 RepID=A0AAD6NNG1_DREDA|nr:hypothetical protein Dda_1896 [Drechslerella dactyloides]